MSSSRVISAQVPEDIVVALDAFAQNHHVNLSAAIRMAVSEAVGRDSRRSPEEHLEQAKYHIERARQGFATRDKLRTLKKRAQELNPAPGGLRFAGPNAGALTAAAESKHH